MTLDITAHAGTTPSSHEDKSNRTARRWRPHRWFWFLLVLFLAALGAFAWWFYFSPTESSGPPATITVGRGDIQETVLASGALKASALVSVGAQVSGTVKAVYVSLGDDVKSGDLIAEIDDTDLQNALRSAQASLDNVRAQREAKQTSLDQNEATLRRSSDLHDKGLISDSDYQAAVTSLANSKADLAALDAQIEQAEIAVESAQSDLSRTKIVSPRDGTVVAVLIDEGQTLSAAQTAPTIAKVADLDTMLIRAEISEADVARVEPGQKVYFNTLGNPDQQIEATLTSIDPAPTTIETSDDVNSNTAIYYYGTFEVANPDHALRIGMTAEVTIVLDEAKNVLTLPASALTDKMPDGAYMVQIYHPDTGAITPQRIEVGLNNNVTAEITSGLAEGDEVVSGSAAAFTPQTDSEPGAGGPPGGFGAFGGPPPGGG